MKKITAKCSFVLLKPQENTFDNMYLSHLIMKFYPFKLLNIVTYITVITGNARLIMRLDLLIKESIVCAPCRNRYTI